MTNLTDKWKKGEIYKGTYYCKSKLDGHQCIAGFVSNKGLFDCAYNGTLNKGYWEVLAEVPSYEEWQDLKSKLQLKETAYDFDTARLEEENTKLKELLKKCGDWLAYIDRDDGLIKQIDEVLGEE